MKKGLLLSLFTLISTAIVAQSAYQFKGNIKGIQDTTCMLAYYYSDKQFARDTAEIDSKGNFVFEGDEVLKGGI